VKKAKHNTAVIRWQDDWVTRIVKKDDKYRKRGYNKKDKVKGEKAQVIDAEKIE
jgi:hypothetical protein